MNNKKILSVLMTMCVAINLLLPMNAFAKTQSDLVVNIGETQINVEQIADANGVDPYALKDAILRGNNAEKASPFSSLRTRTPNTKATEMTSASDVSGIYATTTKKSDQDSTAYVAKSGALTASGKTPEVGMCAMHIDVTTKTGSTTSTKVKLGTTISMTKSVDVNGDSRSSFVVEDRGNPTNRTTYWIDIYFGEKTDATYKAAINYGVKTVSYSYTY